MLPLKRHIEYMKKCIALGEEAMIKGNPPVGSIIVRGDQIIGEGLEEAKSAKDITKHAEIEAINSVIQNTELKNLKGCILYTTHEPCIMCSYALRHYNVETIVYGTSVDFVGGITSDFDIMMTSKVPSWGNPPKIVNDILKQECDNLSIDYEMNLKTNQDEK